MQTLYFVLAGVHAVAVAVTGVMWTLLDLKKAQALKPHFRDIRAVHFGSLYLVPWFLGLSWAFDRLGVAWQHQLAFPVGLGLLVLLAGIGWVFPRPEGLDPFYYWTRGWALVLALLGLACAAGGLIWTGVVLAWYALAGQG
jgi:hypothetical protein